MSKSGIYKLKNRVNGKIYIGKAIDLEKRLYYHRKGKSVNSLICRAIQKYGWDNFDIEILQDYNQINNLELLALEVAFIDFYNATNRDIGYNILLFNFDRTGTKHSINAKRKMSQSQKKWKRSPVSANTRLKMSQAKKEKYYGAGNPFYGKTHTKTTKAIISKKNKGRLSKEKHPMWKKHHKPETKLKMRLARQSQNMSYCMKKVRQIDLQGRCIKIWPSAVSAAKGTGISVSKISTTCRERQSQTYKGFNWRYVI